MTVQPGLLLQLRPLRVILLVSALLTVLGRLVFADASLDGNDWAVVGNIIMPVLAPIFFMLLMLDALMSRVWMSENEGFERQRLKRVMRIDLVAAALLLLFWLPFFISLGK